MGSPGPPGGWGGQSWMTKTKSNIKGMKGREKRIEQEINQFFKIKEERKKRDGERKEPSEVISCFQKVEECRNLFISSFSIQ